MIDRTYIVSGPAALGQLLAFLNAHWKAAVELGTPIICSLKDFSDKRTSDQNAKFHAMLGDVAEQVKWAGEILEVEDWKRLLVASIYGQKVIPSLNGDGFVVLNKRTSKMNKAELSEVIEALYAFGASREPPVKWSHEIPA